MDRNAFIRPALEKARADMRRAWEARGQAMQARRTAAIETLDAAWRVAAEVYTGLAHEMDPYQRCATCAYWGPRFSGIWRGSLWPHGPDWCRYFDEEVQAKNECAYWEPTNAVAEQIDAETIEA